MHTLPDWPGFFRSVGSILDSGGQLAISFIGYGYRKNFWSSKVLSGLGLDRLSDWVETRFLAARNQKVYSRSEVERMLSEAGFDIVEWRSWIRPAFGFVYNIIFYFEKQRLNFVVEQLCKIPKIRRIFEIMMDKIWDYEMERVDRFNERDAYYFCRAVKK